MKRPNPFRYRYRHKCVWRKQRDEDFPDIEYLICKCGRTVLPLFPRGVGPAIHITYSHGREIERHPL